MPNQKPTRSYTWSDAWILAGLLTHGHDGGEVCLANLMYDMDWLERLMPTYDELSYGIMRLQAGGLVQARVDGQGVLWLKATPSAVDMLKGRPGQLSTFRVESILATGGFQQSHLGDISLGRLPRFGRGSFDKAYHKYAGKDDADMRD